MRGKKVYTNGFPYIRISPTANHPSKNIMVKV
jgi:hypothetical protein